jgi:putative transposase
MTRSFVASAFLDHATWECKYHVVFTPKWRKKVLFGKIKRQLGQVFHDLARRKECRIEEGIRCPITSIC